MSRPVDATAPVPGQQDRQAQQGCAAPAEADRTLSHLPLYLAAAYTLLVIYASLHPFSAWRDTGVDPLAFLEAPWPRYWTLFDLASNVLGYFPLGFVWVPALRERLGRMSGFLGGLLLAAVLSMTLEVLQNYLPSRVASNVDFVTNCGGALLGAIAGGFWGGMLLDGGRLHALNQRYLGSGSAAHVGLLMLGMWLLTQFNPETLLFGNGDIRGWLVDLGALEPQSFVVDDFPWVEAAVTASNTLALGLLCRCLLQRRSREIAVLLIVAALLLRTFSFTLLTGNASLAWATEGAVFGLGVGVMLWLPLGLLPPYICQMLAALALMLATTLVNLAPQNPYLNVILQVWHQGHFLNFNGLTRVASTLWPFLVLPWLMLPRKQNPDGKS